MKFGKWARHIFLSVERMCWQTAGLEPDIFFTCRGRRTCDTPNSQHHKYYGDHTVNDTSTTSSNQVRNNFSRSMWNGNISKTIADSENSTLNWEGH